MEKVESENKTNTEEEEKVDPSIDFFSESFDALKALSTLKKLPPGLPKIKPLETLQKCRVLLPKNDSNYLCPQKKDRTT